MSVLAGMMIALGCILYLQIGGLAGALMFSIGLATVCFYNLQLFTGQAGKLATQEITPFQLAKIWVGNFAGVMLMVLIVLVHPHAQTFSDAAKQIMETRAQVGFMGNLLLGIPCGMLMYCAVNAHNNMRLAYIAMCVAAFIMGGFCHCVADMFYTLIGATSIPQAANVLFVTVGNIIGCNLIPFTKKYIA